MERPQVGDAVFLVFLFLIIVFESGRGPLQFKFSFHFLEGQSVSLRQFADKIFDGVVNHAAKAHGRRRTAAKSPRAAE